MSGETSWHYAAGGRQVGPVSAAELRSLIARGQVKPSDLVWCEGMGGWIRAGEAPQLMVAPLMPVQAMSVQGAAEQMPSGHVATVGYYTPSMGIPPRAMATLRGHATPRGDTGRWPLDETDILDFEKSFQLRKPITNAAGLYRGLMALTLIFLAILVPVSLFAVPSPGGPGRLRFGFASAPLLVIIAAFALLYFFAYRATSRSQRWAPVTLLIVFILSAVWQIVSIVFWNMMIRPSAIAMAPLVAPQAFGAVLSILFAYVSGKAASAIPRYLARPAWCQELIVKAKL